MKKAIYPFLLLITPIVAFAQNPVPYLTAQEKYQYVHPKTLKPVISTQYDFAAPFHNNVAIVSNEHNQYLIQPKGQPLTSHHYPEMSPFRNGYAIAYTTGGTVLIQPDGTEKPLNQFLQSWGLADGCAITRDKTTGKMGAIEVATGREILPASHDHIRPFSEGMAAVLDGAQWKFMNKEGKSVFSATYEDAGTFSEGLAGVKVNGHWGFINQKGQQVVSARYDKVTPFSNGQALVQTANGWQAIDLQGKIIREYPYQMMTEPAEGITAFMQDSYWGFANATTGKVIVAPTYTRVSSFADGLALVVKDGTRFYIDHSGRELRAQAK